MSQANLAARVGLSRASIANIEAGRQSVLLHHACSIASALHLASVADLLTPEANTKIDNPAYTLSDEVSARAKAQINGLIANALAASKPRS